MFGSGLVGGVGVKAGSLVGAGGLCNPDCKGERRFIWLLVVRQGVRVPDSSGVGASVLMSVSGWKSVPSCWDGLTWLARSWAFSVSRTRRRSVRCSVTLEPTIEIM